MSYNGHSYQQSLEAHWLATFVIESDSNNQYNYHFAEVPDRELGTNSSETANDVILRRTQSFENDQKWVESQENKTLRAAHTQTPIRISD